jgi:hypothetical protein
LLARIECKEIERIDVQVDAGQERSRLLARTPSGKILMSMPDYVPRHSSVGLGWP